MAPQSSSGSLCLYVVRHSETEWSLSGQYTGRTDIPLTAHGKDAARALGQRIKDVQFTHVLTSPLQRAQQMCSLLSRIFNVLCSEHVGSTRQAGRRMKENIK